MGLFDKFKAYLAEEEPEGENSSEEKPEDIIEDESAPAGEEPPKAPKKGFSLRKLFAGKGDMNEEPVDIKKVSPETKAVSNIKSVRASEIKMVQDFCEQLVDVSTHMNEISREYGLVTRYLTDIQRIEELPVDMAKELIEIASRIQILENNRQNYVQSKQLLPPEQYNTISTYEKEIVEAIKNLYEMEMRDGVLKNDMGYLEGEKENLKYMRDEYSNSIFKIRSLVITVLVMFLLTNCMFAVYAVTTKKSVTVLSLTTGLIAVIAFTISYLQYRSIKTEFRLNEAKIKRAVSLQNKVKAKYINNANTVDYIYEKYGVSSAKELEYRWIQYNTMVQNAEKYNKTNNNLKRLCNDLILRLERIGVEDPDVWTKQITAIIDRREMVEIKHSLNLRRQKLRDNMVTCDKIKTNALAALNAAMAANPGMEEIIKKQLSPYGITLE